MLKLVTVVGKLATQPFVDKSSTRQEKLVSLGIHLICVILLAHFYDVISGYPNCYKSEYPELAEKPPIIPLCLAKI